MKGDQTNDTAISREPGTRLIPGGYRPILFHWALVVGHHMKPAPPKSRGFTLTKQVNMNMQPHETLQRATYYNPSNARSSSSAARLTSTNRLYNGTALKRITSGRLSSPTTPLSTMAWKTLSMLPDP